MKKNLSVFGIALLLFVSVFNVSCTKEEDDMGGNITESQIPLVVSSVSYSSSTGKVSMIIVTPPDFDRMSRDEATVHIYNADGMAEITSSAGVDWTMEFDVVNSCTVNSPLVSGDQIIVKANVEYDANGDITVYTSAPVAVAVN